MAQMASLSIPASILEDPAINAAIESILPSAYNFEIHKTIHHIRTHQCRSVALQMPEGLTLWATGIADILERFSGADMTIMGDVTYGACCVDDYTALALGCDLLVHYGHSCLVPVDQTKIKTLYVFVEISVDRLHLAETVRANFPSDKEHFRQTVLGAETVVPEGGKARIEIGLEAGQAENLQHSSIQEHTRSRRSTHLALVGTVQFINAIQGLRDALEESAPQGSLLQPDKPLLTITDGTQEPDQKAYNPSTSPSFSTGNYIITVPQIKPLSPGEVLGCTSPRLPSSSADRDGVDAIIYLGDGRFHLESVMIANPRIPAFRYDPYTKRFMRELYDHKEMRSMRGQAVQTARTSIEAVADRKVDARVAGNAKNRHADPAWAVVLGTLGRQGSTSVLSHIRSMLASGVSDDAKQTGSNKSFGKGAVPSIPILLSELSPQKLALFGSHISTFVQTSCPRLSIDWGSAFEKPLLSPYEAAVALRKTRGWDVNVDGLGMKRRPLQTQAERSPAGLSNEGSVERATEHVSEGDMEGDYPMDFYANDSRGPWTPRHGMNAPRAKTGKSALNLAILKRTKARMAEQRALNQQREAGTAATA
ncbi:hypothetical protein K437DRAFT_253999 [Tilletiaria anomala UBC 951]|uniref:2-(3-amino-3-carboxypropyl)histidine synthase subunit 1 n=1 Tax=Tilletiaria anomala (strain ATCC 24038 / CBS 436.72 / UBC 951) TaxID=1037660 RepID=A0A066WF41_TILAU|nr:uncharacterized protein K437DRAFT_253999 [Tilletiaria anomala UBC 951]KDN52597.1 hypothetical protein K437DRAFT_253999 [Tilletiaria anomala UBC 951]